MKRENLALLIIFIIGLSFRLYFVFQTPNFSSDEAYFHLRHVSYISENLKPLIYDELSYGGRYVANAHFFHYILGLFTLILPIEITLKIIPAVIAALIAIVVFGISMLITENKNASLLAAFISLFLPTSLTLLLNKVSVYPLTLIITFYMIYYLLGIKRNIVPFIIFSFILPILDPLSFIFALALMFYAALLYLDSIAISRLRKEAVVFAIFVTILINFLLFKKAFLQFGLEAIWQNTPKELLADYFKGISILETVYSIGVIPLLFGIIGFASGLFREKKQSVYLISGFILADVMLLLLRLINFQMGMLLLGLLMTIMGALSFAKLDSYFTITKFARYKGIIAALFVMLIIVTLVLPSYYSAKEIMKKAVTNDEIEVMEWIKANTPKEATIVADVSEGHMINSIAERKNVADENFLLAKKRYVDIVSLFKTESVVQAVEILQKYKANYFYVSKRSKEKYKKEELVYLRDENCFKRVHSSADAEVYEILC